MCSFVLNGLNEDLVMITQNLLTLQVKNKICLETGPLTTPHFLSTYLKSKTKEKSNYCPNRFSPHQMQMPPTLSKRPPMPQGFGPPRFPIPMMNQSRPIVGPPNISSPPGSAPSSTPGSAPSSTPGSSSSPPSKPSIY